MSRWTVTVDALQGLPFPPLPPLPGRVHLLQDDSPGDLDELQALTARDVARLTGCNGPAARARLAKARKSGDFSGLLAAKHHHQTRAIAGGSASSSAN